jgi:hypothetical protein
VPKPRDPNASADRLKNLLASLETTHRRVAVAPLAKPEFGAVSRTGPSSNGAAADGRAGEAGLEDAIREQVERRWEFDVASLGAADLVVAIRIGLDLDGKVSRADIVDDPRYRGDSRYAALAGSVRNAVLLSSPLQLPPELVAAFRDVTVRFSPKDVLR